MRKNNQLKTKMKLILFSITLITITACQTNENKSENKVIDFNKINNFTERTIDINEITEEQQQRNDKLLEERELTKKIFIDGVDYYNGDKGKIQNLGKAEDLLRNAAERGAPFAPHYLAELLIKKYDKLSPAERTLSHFKECYFWLLIAKSHTNQKGYYGYHNNDYHGDVLRYKYKIEEKLTAAEIQEIQDKATICWEAKISN